MTGGVAMNMNLKTADSSYAWFRLAISLALATIGGIGLWLVVVLGGLAAGRLQTGSSPFTSWGDRSVAWYAATFAASLVVGAMLTFAQTRRTDRRLRSAVTTGLMLGILGAVGVLAAGVNAGTMSIAGPRAAILLFGVIAASMLVFARRGRSQ